MGLLPKLLTESQVTEKQKQELTKSAKQILKAVETTSTDEDDPISAAAFQSAANNAKQQVSAAKGLGPAPDSKEARKAKKKENEWHDPNEQIKYVNEQGKVSCTFCSSLIGDVKVTSAEVKLQDALWATAGDKNGAANIQFKGMCNHPKWGKYKPPCSGVIQLGEWKDLSSTIIDSQPALLRKSTIPCNISGLDIKIEHSGQRAVLEELPGDSKNEEDYRDPEDTENVKCAECSKEFTIEQIKAVCGGSLAKKGQLEADAENNVKIILAYLNKYRKDYKLDTCVRKAHFIAQALTESANFQSLGETGGGEHYSAARLIKTFNNTKKIRFHSDALLKDYYIQPVTDEKKCFGFFSDEQLQEMIKLEYSKDYKKTKQELKDLLKDAPYNTIKVHQAALYGGSKQDTFFDKDIELYKDADLTITLKKHAAHDVESLSRAYQGRPDDLDNGDELSRDGYKFMGKGILQLTGRISYREFTKFRNEGIKKNISNFIDDDPNNPELDFTKDDSDSTKTKPKGTYDKLLDSKEPIYAVQSAVWEWAIDKNKKRLIKYADEENLGKVTKIINGGYNGLATRLENIKRARKDDAFKVYAHYENIYINGTLDDKKKVMTNLNFLSKDNYEKDGTTEKNINLKDDSKEANDLLIKLKAKEEEEEKNTLKESKKPQQKN